jgi:hypothetical protein
MKKYQEKVINSAAISMLTGSNLMLLKIGKIQ